MPTASQAQGQPNSFAGRFAKHDPSVSIRAITKALVEIWPLRGNQPKNPRVASKRAKVMNGQADPIGTLYLIALGALDEGKPVDVVTQFAADFIASCRQYAERRPKQSSGILPLKQRHDRVLVASILEDAEADCREATVDLDDIDSLEQARAERLEAMSKDQRKIELYTSRLAELRLTLHGR